MARKQIIALVVVGGMILVGGILALGDLRDDNRTTTGTVTSVTADVQSAGVVLLVSGSRESCELITSWEQKLKGDLIVVTPVFTVAGDAACDTMVPFEESVTVDVGDLQAGTYRVDVLGVVTTVMLDAPITSFNFKNLSSESFDKFTVPVTPSVAKADLDISSFGADAPITELQYTWPIAAVNFADRLAIVSVPCAESCTNHFVVDITTGKLVRQFTSAFGIIAQAGSTLFIVNNPEVIASAGTADPVAAEAYVFDTASRTFIFIAQGDYLFGELQN